MVAESRRERVRHEVFRHQRVVAFVPGVDIKIAAGIEPQGHGGEGDRHGGGQPFLARLRAVCKPEEEQDGDDGGEAPRCVGDVILPEMSTPAAF
ncbi:MAG TPA: hypothetical protein VHR45_21010 [Thermoanaerobaculia bacterium]|nr:hypothetical protein [Thermoanaerobaculia bacterium]